MEHAFPCGNLSLDFVGTLRARRNPEPTEMLGSPASLDAWFRESGIADAGAPSGAADLDAALALREAIYTLVRASLTGEALDTESLDIVNDSAAEPSAIPRLAPDGPRTTPDGLRSTATATPTQALSSVARDAIEVLIHPTADLLKECGRPECTQVYLDHSRGGRREWCAMETCGNKMKAAAYRARKRTAGAPTAATGPS
ncbi:CGNR zinc finger domain-containing protein [Plantibacter sp. YIM 135249]|uniref:CGNR zinc finger domain-containing protein n=1 Tax=Plantibacter sp. YIM 135249 TaxID=3423918 RepID=UPI003D332508